MEHIDISSVPVGCRSALLGFLRHEEAREQLYRANLEEETSKMSDFKQKSTSERRHQITANFLQNDFICRGAIHCDVRVCTGLQLVNSNLYKVVL